MVQIAMWSGPRNLSTALMRSWENRPDTTVVDEPLYAFYLHATGLDHPARDEVIASQPTDWRVVVGQLTKPGPTEHSYQKHMTHHLLPQIDRSLLAPLSHAFLIRDPRRVVASYSKVRDEPTLDDLGLPQQLDLFRSFGGPVIDADDLACDPEPTLRRLCESLGVGFDEAMLSWPAGARDSDGVWAPHWYDGVRASTHFSPPSDRPIEMPERLQELLDRCLPIYEELSAAVKD